jgi:hypothetical protein
VAGDEHEKADARASRNSINKNIKKYFVLWQAMSAQKRMRDVRKNACKSRKGASSRKCRR